MKTLSIEEMNIELIRRLELLSSEYSEWLEKIPSDISNATFKKEKIKFQNRMAKKHGLMLTDVIKYTGL